MPRVRLVSLVLLLCGSAFLAAAPPGISPDGPFVIRFNRPAKAGNSSDVHIQLDVAGSATTTIPGQPVSTRPNNLKAELSGRVAISAVDANGNETAFTITVKQFSVNAEPDAAAAGAVIEVKRSDKELTAAVRGGAKLSDDALQALKQVYSTINASNIDDDAVFGTKTPRKINESWPIDSTNAAKQAAGQSLAVDPKNISGNTTVTGAEQVNGVPAVRLVSHIEYSDARPGDMPNELHLDSAKTTAEISQLFPLDPSLPPLESLQSSDTHMVCSADGARPVKIEIVSRMSLKISATPVK